MKYACRGFSNYPSLKEINKDLGLVFLSAPGRVPHEADFL